MKIFSKKPKLHDGYIMKDGLIHFYRDSAYNRVLSDEVFKVDEDKVTEYEGMCNTLRENFMEIGQLRLHTPVDIHQERLGTNFLYVPPKERTRIMKMLEGGTLITLDSLKWTFCEIGTGKHFTLDELIGSGELVDLSEIGEQNREKLQSGIISEEEIDKQAKAIRENKFFIGSLEVEGMFVQREKTWLDKLGLRG